MPDCACLRIAMICASLKRDVFMGILSILLRENSTFDPHHFWGGLQSQGGMSRASLITLHAGAASPNRMRGANGKAFCGKAMVAWARAGACRDASSHRVKHIRTPPTHHATRADALRVATHPGSHICSMPAPKSYAGADSTLWNDQNKDLADSHLQPMPTSDTHRGLEIIPQRKPG